MADTVQRLLEDMVPELEDLQRKGLLSKAEIQQLVMRRQDLEYKLRRVHISKIDFLRAIEYELNLVALITKRREKLCLTKKGPADFAVMRRISFLYERALRKFHTDTALWKQYLEYLRRTGSVSAISRVLPRAIQLNPKDTSLWLLHASWEMEHNSNIEGARTILQRALRLNPTARDVWTSFFSLEIRFIAKMLERRRRMGLIAGDAKQKNTDADVALKVEPEGQLDDNTRAAGDLSKKQIGALFACLLPRAIFSNACRTRELKDDLQFRLEFLRHIPSPLSAALSALPQPDVPAGAVPMERVSLASFAYNHNGEDELLSAFLQFNGKSAAAIAAELAEREAQGADMVDVDEENPLALRQSTKPYHVDFLPLCEDILASVKRDFPHEPQAVRLQAEFAFIRARLESDGVIQTAASEDDTAAAASASNPAQRAWAVFEQALAPAAVDSMQAAAVTHYRAHKQLLDADPPTAYRLHHVSESLWQTYASFSLAVLKSLPDDVSASEHVTHLFARFNAGQEEQQAEAATVPPVLTEQIVRLHAEFLLECGRVSEALAVLGQALQPKDDSDSDSDDSDDDSSAAAAAPSFSKSPALWSRYLELHVLLHSFQGTAHNSKKRRQGDSVDSVLALFERAVQAVAPEKQLSIYSQLLAFHRAQLLSAAHPSTATSTASVTPLVAAYLSVHQAYRRVLGLVPAPQGDLAAVKEEYLSWARTTLLSDVYVQVQRQAMRTASSKAVPPARSNKKARKASGAAALDSDDEDDLSTALSWAAGVPLPSLSGAAALRATIDWLLATPPLSLTLVHAAIQAEDALNPEVPAVPTSAASGAAAAASTAAVAAGVSAHVRRVRDLYERALSVFGRSSADLWFSYLSWSRAQGNARLSGLLNANQVHFRATRELQGAQQARWAELQTILVQ